MCNLFISCVNEDDEDYEPEVALENRVFVCLGCNKDNEITGWVMVFNKNLIDVTFWDPIHHKNYELKGRVSADNKDDLKKYLT